MSSGEPQLEEKFIADGEPPLPDPDALGIDLPGTDGPRLEVIEGGQSPAQKEVERIERQVDEFRSYYEGLVAKAAEVGVKFRPWEEIQEGVVAMIRVGIPEDGQVIIGANKISII